MIDRGVRTPPRPPFEGRAGCPMCGEKPKEKRRRWHPECVEMWHYIAFPQIAISLLVKLHGRKCWSCGRVGALELEHIRPLWSLSDEERRDLKWWLPFNLQLLCRECHAAKTAREARERFGIVARRLAAERDHDRGQERLAI